MRDTDRTAFVATLNGLAAIKPNMRLTKEAIALWWRCMRHWRIEDFERAAEHLALTEEFAPSPYHFENLRRAGRPKAGEAWAAVLSAVRKGRHLETARPVVDGFTDCVVECIGGYVAIGMSTAENTHFLERRFAEHFDSLVDAELTREAVPQIASEPAPRRISGPRRLIG